MGTLKSPFVGAPATERGATFPGSDASGQTPPQGQSRACGALQEGSVPMLDLRNRVGVRRWVADFALAFVLFWAAALGFGVAHSRAYAVPLPVLGREVVTPDAGPL